MKVHACQNNSYNIFVSSPPSNSTNQKGQGRDERPSLSLCDDARLIPCSKLIAHLLCKLVDPYLTGQRSLPVHHLVTPFFPCQHCQHISGG